MLDSIGFSKEIRALLRSLSPKPACLPPAWRAESRARSPAGVPAWSPCLESHGAMETRSPPARPRGVRWESFPQLTTHHTVPPSRYDIYLVRQAGRAGLGESDLGQAVCMHACTNTAN